MFAAKGFAATTIEDVMGECGLTRGGFYAHFRSKARLYHEAVAGQGTVASAEAGDGGLADWLGRLFVACRQGCEPDIAPPVELAFLATDTASRTPEVRQSYERAVTALRDRLRSCMPDSRHTDDKALAASAMIVGTLAIALSIDDRQLRATTIAACDRNVRAMFEEADAGPRQTFFWALDGIDSCRFHDGVHTTH
ncbi:MAG: TetR/AcrR family transcriptional regulator; helix-turn-helix transcriptional regulator [Burkholderiaceae bacterium]|nr:TetR/AcrR family transcriptional regulator; helix-turn-helix transcriptional regulator [Sulfuritalea sp.]MCF8174451.1 TetR/AcrR family transcriptional regulator; helix-turn-helix transcriptional regulator [Burkholderiaceae bacterium]MCF8184859.1 TetR/AcrR family transcriptional regulator; helix-turn-helix transcriptional regulator [Polynucleobacter sp.]